MDFDWCDGNDDALCSLKTVARNRPVYPPALYTGIACAAELGLPIYVTENGCPDHLDDERRTLWIHGYINQVWRSEFC